MPRDQLSRRWRTQLYLPTGPGLAPATWTLEFNTTQQALFGGGSGRSGANPRVLSVTRPNQTLTNSTTADQDYTSVFTSGPFPDRPESPAISALIHFVSVVPATQSHYLDKSGQRGFLCRKRRLRLERV